VKAAPVTAVAFGLVSVMVSVEVPPVPMVASAKAFVAERPASTSSVALAAAVLEPALVVVSPPAAMVLA
jgi:hypothetical protein